MKQKLVNDAPKSHRHLIEEILRTAETVCKDRGLRFTKIRRKVLQLVLESRQPIKAYDLLDKLKDVASAKPPTAYRALEFLIKSGFVHKLSSMNAYVGCSHPLKSHECYFLICSDCKGVEECCDSMWEQAIQRAARKHTFKPKRTTLEISGRCQRCANRN